MLLGDKLFDIMDILHDDGTSFVVISNGLLLTKKFARLFNKYRYFWFQISIDGSTAELHDEFRGVKGSFERAVNGALEISDLGIPLVIAHTVTPKNLAYVEDRFNLSYNLGANSIILSEVMPSGRAYEHEEIILSDEQKNYLYGQIEDFNNKYRGKIVIQRSTELKIHMKPTAAFFIELADGKTTVGDIKIKFLARYAVDERELEKDFVEIDDTQRHHKVKFF